MRLMTGLAFFSLALSGCDRTEKDSELITSTPTPAPEDSTPTDDSGEPTGDYLEVAAMGFEYKGGWDEENQLLENFLYTDSNGDIQPAGPYILVTLASTHYFDLTSEDAGYDQEYCEFIASFYYEAREFSGTEFDWNAGHGGTGVDLETWSSFEGYLVVEPSTFSDRCYALDPAVFPGGDPVGIMDEMHFGLGFGPLSDYLYDLYSASEDFATYEDAYMTQYIAINHPDGAGGYTFDAYDWNGALLIDTDYSECVDVDDGSGGTFEVCGLPQVDADNYYVPGDTTISPRRGYMTGFSYWLEDIPNLDLSILKEGIGF